MEQWNNKTIFAIIIVFCLIIGIYYVWMRGEAENFESRIKNYESEKGAQINKIYENGIELIEKRTETSKTYFLGYTENGKAKYAWRGSIGPIHYKEDYNDVSELWKNIDLVWENNKITKAPYELTVNGKKITVEDKKTGNISTIELIDIGGKEVSFPNWSFSEGLARYENVAKDTDLEIIAEPARISFARVLKSDKAPSEVRFRIAGDIPLLTYAEDKEGELPVRAFLENGILTEAIDKLDRSIKYAVRIDPELELQMAASADDGYGYYNDEYNYGYWDAGFIYAGHIAGPQYTAETWHRFANVTLDQGAVITEGKLSVKAKASLNGADCNMRVYGNDVDDAVNPAGADAGEKMLDYNSKGLTGEYADWTLPAMTDGTWYDSPVITAVLQEIVDRVGFASGNDIALMLRKNSPSWDAYRRIGGYDDAVADAAKLLITYEEAAPAGYEMGSDSYLIWESSINAGGHSQTSTSYKMRDTIGEFVAGTATSTSYKLKMGYQPMLEGVISLTSPSDVVLNPDIGGVSGGTADGSATWKVTTDNPAGYTLSIQASTTPALATSSYSFADYTPAAAGTPDYTWLILAADSEFGFTPEGTDIAQKFKNNDSNACATGTSDTADKCWYNFAASDENIALRYFSNHPSGTDTAVKFRAESGASHIQENGVYQATIIVTAAAN